MPYSAQILYNLQKSTVSLQLGGLQKIKGANVKAGSVGGRNIVQNEQSKQVQGNQTFVSFVKEKINCKLSKLRKNFEERIFLGNKARLEDTEICVETSQERNIKKREESTKILESD